MIGKITPELLLQKSEINKAALGRLLETIEANGHKLIDWERFGTPAIDRIVATIEGPTKGSGALVEKLVQLPGGRTRIRDIFPKGVPAPEGLRLKVELTAGQLQ
jgi:hypothetical protein